MKYVAHVANHDFSVDVINDTTISINGKIYRVDSRSIDGEQIYSFLINDHSYEIYVNRIDNGYDVLVAGERHEVIVEDEGTGLSNSANLFVPFFTTKKNGSGIGLILSRQIAEAHGGSITLENRKDRPGCCARLRLPTVPLGSNR